MGVAVPQAPVGSWGMEPPQSLINGSSLLVNCYLEKKFHNKIRLVIRLYHGSVLHMIRINDKAVEEII